jgi:hypothetical protein
MADILTKRIMNPDIHRDSRPCDDGGKEPRTPKITSKHQKLGGHGFCFITNL